MAAPDNMVPLDTLSAPPDLGSGTLAGPWTSAFWVKLPRVRSKSNFRRGDEHAAALWDGEKSFRDTVESALRSARPADWPACEHADPLSARPQFVVGIGAASLLDTGNISKSVLDAGEGVLYVNDAQVRVEASWTERRRSNQTGWVGFAALPPRSAADSWFAAQFALQRFWLTTERF